MRILIIFLWLLLGGFYYYLSQNHCNSSFDSHKVDAIAADSLSNLGIEDLGPNSYIVTKDFFQGSHDFKHIKDSLLATLSSRDSLTIYGMEGGTARAQDFIEKMGLTDARIKAAGLPTTSFLSNENDESISDKDSLSLTDQNLTQGNEIDNADSATKAKTDKEKIAMVCACLRRNLKKVVLTVSDVNRETALKRSRAYNDQLILCGLPPHRIITIIKSKGITENSLETLIQE